MPTAATNPPGLTASALPSPKTQAKCCTKCGECKSLDKFERRRERSAGYRGECKDCRNKAKVKTGEQVQQIVERRRTRKKQARTPRQQAAEMTAQNLIWALDNIPPGEEFDEWRAVLNRAVSQIRKSGRRTPSIAARAVAEVLGNPFNKHGATAADLASDTGIPENIVLKILDSMISVKTVYKFPKDVPEIARGATIWLYKLTGDTPSTPQVLP